MLSKRVIVPLLFMNTCVWCLSSETLGNSYHHNINKVNKHHEISEDDEQQSIPFSPKRLEKMLEKAILKIITGDLSTSDILLLKSLNYSIDEILEIRERELAKKITDELQVIEENNESNENTSNEIDYDAYNKKAMEDYEMMANKMEDDYSSLLDSNDSINANNNKNSNNEIRVNFDRAMEPHVVFKIRYDDAEFDSSSREILKSPVKFVENVKIPPRTSTKPLPIVYHLAELSKSSENNFETTEAPEIEDNKNLKDEKNDSVKRTSPYEGLEWVEDDVYRVIPEALNYDSNNYEELNDTIDNEYNIGNNSMEEMTNDYGYQDDGSADLENSTRNQMVGNLTAYQQLALAHRREENESPFSSQGQKAIEDIKLRVLALTGRFNLSTNSNQVQRERLTMFSPTCQIPRNTDTEPWFDPFSMNMHFLLNLTSGDHIVAAKLRIYKLPQTNLTIQNSSVGTIDEEEAEEKKVRISIYYYTKSLKKHRSKKRLMDSVVTSLTPEGSHLALDVRQALRFWRQSQTSKSIHPNSVNNHGLVIQIEDQDGRPLKPGFYIQQDNCHANDEDTDEKAYQRFPALFLQACARYVRFVNGETVTYVNCKNLKNLRH